MKWNILCRNVNFPSISMIFGLVVEINILDNIFPIYIWNICDKLSVSLQWILPIVVHFWQRMRQCWLPATYLLFLNEGWAILKALYTTYICEAARVCSNFTAYNSIKSKYYQCIGFRLKIKQPKKLIEL